MLLLVDPPDLGDTLVLGDEGKQTVVRPDDEVSALQLRDDGPPLGTHAGVDDGDEHGACRPVGQRDRKLVGPLPDVEGLDLLGQVVELQIAVHAERHALHGRHRTVLRPEIGLDDDQAVDVGRRLGARTDGEAQEQRQQQKRATEHRFPSGTAVTRRSWHGHASTPKRRASARVVCPFPRTIIPRGDAPGAAAGGPTGRTRWRNSALDSPYGDLRTSG